MIPARIRPIALRGLVALACSTLAPLAAAADPPAAATPEPKTRASHAGLSP